MKNPILSDPEIVSAFNSLDTESRKALKSFCAWLYEHSKKKADESWAKSKAPMAVYWKAVAAWAYHIKGAIKV